MTQNTQSHDVCLIISGGNRNGNTPVSPGWHCLLHVPTQAQLPDVYVVVSKNSETVHDYCRERNACARSRISHVESQKSLILPRIKTLCWPMGSVPSPGCVTRCVPCTSPQALRRHGVLCSMNATPEAPSRNATHSASCSDSVRLKSPRQCVPTKHAAAIVRVKCSAYCLPYGFHC